MSEPVSVKMRIDDLESDFKLFDKEPDSQKRLFNFNISTQLQIFEVKKQFLSIHQYDIVHEGGNDVLATITVKATFGCNEFETITKKDSTGNIGIPEKAIGYFNQVTYNTSRGIIFEYLKNTHLNNAVLPLFELPIKNEPYQR